MQFQGLFVQTGSGCEGRKRGMYRAFAWLDRSRLVMRMWSRSMWMMIRAALILDRLP